MSLNQNSSSSRDDEYCLNYHKCLWMDVKLKGHLRSNIWVSPFSKFDERCKSVLNQAKSTVSRLSRLIGCHITLNSTTKIILYKWCIRSLLTYNIHVWDDISNTNMKKLESFQNKCLKLRPHPVTHREVRTDTVHQLAKVNTLKSYDSTIKSHFI